MKVKNDQYSNMNYFIYTSHHFTPHRKIWTQLIDLTPNVWLHSSVGRASHGYRRGHGFKSRWSPDFFRLLLSNCLNWKIYCDDHSSLSSTTVVQIWIISYILHIKDSNLVRTFEKQRYYMSCILLNKLWNDVTCTEANETPKDAFFSVL